MSNAIKYLSKFKMFLLLIIYSISIIGIFLLVDHYIYTTQTKKDLLQNSISVSKATKKTVDEYFQSKVSLLESVRKSNAFYDYLSEVTIYQDSLSDLFLAIARNQRDIMQIRFIDANGMEKVRVDRKALDENPKKIKNNELQDKSNRYYFTSPDNQKDKIWFSNLDLNVENGKVQVPYVSTIRAIQPVYDAQKYRGIIIINFFAKEFLDKITESDLYQIAIFDENRNIIRHFNSKYNWNAYTKIPYDLSNHVKISNDEIKKRDVYVGDIVVVRELNMPVENDFFIKYRINVDYLKELETKKFDTFSVALFFVIILVLIFSIIIANIFGRLLNDIITSQEKAINASRAKSEFLANMSHEIRTPLNGVLGLIQLTLDTKLNKKQQDFLYKAKSSSNALMTVINDILDYSKIEAGKLTLKKQEFILQSLVDNVTDLFGFKIHEKGIKLKFSAQNDVPNILVSDNLRITQILNNLVGNAVKFTHEGEITITVKLLNKDVENKKVELEFCISDTGIGIGEEDLKRLFNAFIQAEDSNTKKYGGTGLGLTITKQLSNLLGGDVRVESQKGIGSKFYFTINCEYRDNLNSLEIKKFMANKRFLIVDDDKSQIEYLETIASSWNAFSTSVTDGFKAIELIEKQKFDYVLLDWNMPIINGIDVLKTLKDKKLDVPFVIMVTAYEKNDLMDKLNDEKLEIRKVISKPFTPSLLFEEISTEVKRNEKLKNFVMDLKFEGKALLVEDNEVNQLVASKFLEKFGLIIEIANDGLEAVKMVDENDYDIIFMDLQMPNMDGFEATKIIRQKGNKTPIIALSAAVMQKDRDDTKAVGMNKHIAKPIVFDELREILLEYLNVNDNKEDENKESEIVEVELTASEVYDDSIKIHGLDVRGFCESTEIEKDVLISMLNSYYDSNKDTTDLLKTYEKESKEFKQLIHKLKGSSGNFQLHEIYKICVEIEKCEDASLLDELLDRLYVELELTLGSIHGVVVENKENKQKSDFDMNVALDELITKASEFSFITQSEVNDVLNNLPNGFEEDVKNELKKAFEIKDYEKLEENLLKIKGLLK